MSFFKKIFGGQDTSSKTTSAVEPVTETKIKRTIFDFFQIDLKSLPDDSYIKAETEENVSGESVEFYRKTLNYKECGLFDTVEVRIIGGTNKNISLKCFDLSSVRMENLKKLVDDLYLIYGNDSSDKGKFTNKDLEDFKDREFYMLFGRSWNDYPKYKYPVMISRDEDEVEIAIWGVGNE